MTTTTPVRREVVVPVGAERAFTLFTDQIGAWWPIGDVYSVFGAGATVSFRDGVLVEVAPDGREAVWGEVLDWRPPNRFRITWHPGRDATAATEVTVSFMEQDGQTTVVLEHSGWERLASPEARASYDTGWVFVLGQFESHCRSSR